MQARFGPNIQDESFHEDRNNQVYYKDSVRGESVNYFLEVMGGFGAFQKVTTFNYFLSILGLSMFWMSFFFFELSPEFLCTKVDASGTRFTKQCTREQMCATNDFTEYTVKDSYFSLVNWNQQVGIWCTTHAYVGLIGSFSFAGSAIACIFLPYLADNIGRQPVWQAVQFMHLPVFIAAIYAPNLTMIFSVSFFMGMLLVGKMTVGYVFMIEMVPEQKQVMAGLLVMVGFPIAQILSTLILIYSRETVNLLYVGFFFNAITFCVCLAIPESPQWLVSQK